MWIIAALLGVTSVILMLIPKRQRFGMLGAAFTLFLVAGEFIAIHPIATVIFWVAWIIGLAMSITIVAENIKTFLATIMPSFGTAVTAIALAAAGLFGVSIALPLPGGGVQNLAVESSLSVEDMPELTDQVKAKECPPAKGPRYYAYEAEKNTHAMGPAIEVDTVEAGAYRFAVKSLCDPLWLATTKHYVLHGKNLDQTAVQNEAQILAKDPAKWMEAIEFVKNKVKTFHLVNAGDVKYDSLGMIPGANPAVMPTLTKFSSQPSLGQALVAELKDGSSRYFRVACDLQPSELVFAKVPKAEKPEVPPTKPPTKVTPPPSTPSTSTVTTTTETTETTTTETTPSTSTTTTTPETSTTTTTPETSTTTTTPETSTTTTTPETSTTTTSPKGDVTVPDGLPTDTTHGEPETTDPVESDPGNPETTEGQSDPGEQGPGATQEPEQPAPTVEPTGGAEPTDPHEGDVDPNASVVTASSTSALGGMAAFTLLLGGVGLRKKLEKKGARK